MITTEETQYFIFRREEESCMLGDILLALGVGIGVGLIAKVILKIIEKNKNKNNS